MGLNHQYEQLGDETAGTAGPSGPHTFLTDFGFINCDVPRFNGVQSVHCLLSESRVDQLDQTIAENCTWLFPLYKQQGDKENRIDKIVHL